MGPGLDAEITVDTHVTLEAARNTHVTRAFDLALDGQIRCYDGFSALG